MTQAQNLANLSQDYGVIPMSCRNLIVDGAFDSWTASSGTISPSSGYVGPTMWVTTAGTGGAGSVTSSDIRTTSWVTDSNPANILAFGMTTPSTGTVAARTAPLLLQRIEGAQRFAGRSATLQFKMAASVPTVITGIAAQQYFGTGGSPSPMVIFDKTVNWNLSNTFGRYSVRLDIPSVNGKTFGTSGTDSLMVGLWLPPGFTGTIWIAEAQLELSNPLSSSDINGKGGEPTAFEYRGMQAELARVQRYYQVLPDFLCGGYVGAASGNVFTDFTFPTMRIAPAASLVGTPTYSNASALTINGFSANKGRLNVTITANYYGVGYGAQVVMDARL